MLALLRRAVGDRNMPGHNFSLELEGCVVSIAG